MLARIIAGCLASLTAFVLTAPSSVAETDNEAPIILTLTANPNSVDVTETAQKVWLRALIKDNVGIVSTPMFTLYSATSSQYLWSYGTRVSGTAQDGVYRAVFTLESNATRGSWHAHVQSAEDAADNRASIKFAYDVLTVTGD